MNALVTIERLALPVELTAPLKLAADFARASKAPATQAAYGSDFRIFEAWCAVRGISRLPRNAHRALSRDLLRSCGIILFGQ